MSSLFGESPLRRKSFNREVLVLSIDHPDIFPRGEPSVHRSSAHRPPVMLSPKPSFKNSTNWPKTIAERERAVVINTLKRQLTYYEPDAQ